MKSIHRGGFVAALALATSLAATGCAAHHAHHHDDHGASNAHHDNKVVRAGKAADVANPFHPVFVMLSSEENAGGVTVYEFQVPPKSPGSPPHTHTLEDEYFYVLEGELSALSGDEVLTLGPGDFAALNRGNTHMFWNGSDAPVRLIMATTGGSFEKFMAETGPRVADAKPQSPEEFGAVIGQLAAEYGITISMEKMPKEAAPIYAPK